MKPIQPFIRQSDELLTILVQAHALRAASLLKLARERLERDEFDESLALCHTLQSEYPAQSEACGHIRHDVCIALVARGSAAMSANEWQKAQAFAQKAMELQPDQAEAARIRAEAGGKIHLQSLASAAFVAYNARDTEKCRTACHAFLTYQKTNDLHVAFTYPGSGEVIDFAALPAKLSQEIEAQRAAEIRVRKEQLRARRAIFLHRLIKVAAVCAALVLLVMAIGHWRKARFEKRIRAFDTAFQSKYYDEAKDLAPKIAGKYALAADLVAYFCARIAFETTLLRRSAVLHR